MPARDLTLITGGAGFIGSHVADALLERGYRVRVLDNLHEQVHGATSGFPSYLSPEVEALHGDVRDPQAVDQALEGVTAVYHFASAVGVGQSMYQIERYTDVNNRGTAVLLEALLRNPVRKLIVASSMSLYGEGQYRAPGGALINPPPRTTEQLREGRWDIESEDGEPLEPVATNEDKPAAPQSIYALSKHDQEVMCLLFGRTYGVPVVALRFFNVYGTRQALSNPYTGVLAIFASRYLNGRAPIVFENGRQQRDFVHVHDLAQACRLALESEAASGVSINVGSGQSCTILDIARHLARALGRDEVAPHLPGNYRAGDVRHCFADITRARNLLGYRPRHTLQGGLADLAAWLTDRVGDDRIDAAVAELRERGLVA